MGLIGAVFALASIGGPLLGGFFVEALSWRWVFYINIPIGRLAILVVTSGCHLHTPLAAPLDRLPRRRPAHRRRQRLILVTGWGGNQYPWGSPAILGLAVAALVLLFAFVVQERRAAEPIIPLGLFRSSVFRVATGLGFIIGLAMFGAIIFIPLFLQLVFGVSPTSSGLHAAPDGRTTGGEHHLRPDHQPHRPLQAFPDRRHRNHRHRNVPAFPARGGYGPVGRVAVHARRRHRHRPGDAGPRPRRAERRTPARRRRRDLDRDVLPVDGRVARGRDLRRDLRVAADERAHGSAPGNRIAPHRRHQRQPCRDTCPAGGCPARLSPRIRQLAPAGLPPRRGTRDRSLRTRLATRGSTSSRHPPAGPPDTDPAAEALRMGTGASTQSPAHADPTPSASRTS